MDEIDEFDRDAKRILRNYSDEELPYVVHKRNRSPNYWMWFSINGHGQQRFGLGTADLDEAIIKAKHGILEGATSFDRLTKEYMASLFKEVDTITYARGHKSEINRPAIHAEPSLNTLKREANVLRGIFKFAVRKGYLKSGDVPKLELGRGVKKKRPAFTRDQLNQLILVSEKRLMEAAKDPQLRYQRFLDLPRFSSVSLAWINSIKETYYGASPH